VTAVARLASSTCITRKADQLRLSSTIQDVDVLPVLRAIAAAAAARIFLSRVAQAWISMRNLSNSLAYLHL
jgi:hypothetical protein